MAFQTPKKISRFEYIGRCADVSEKTWYDLMGGTTKANGRLIRNYIKYYYPEMYYALGLQFNNPYEHYCRKKRGLFVYVHSAIEYFFIYD